LARAIATELDLPGEFIYYLEFAALMHDIGKIAIDESLLKKPGKLTPQEFETIKKHPELGYKILEAVERGNIDDVGLCFDQHWEYKKKISTQMSNPRFDEIYSLAKQSGALGGKISGAGGGGFFTFYVPKNHADFRVAMKKNGLREMRYHFDFEGSKVLVDLEIVYGLLIPKLY
jgi:galactokinase/mevalonate kinase-like predicted kinase